MIGVHVKIEKPQGLKRVAQAHPLTWRQALVAGLGSVIATDRQKYGADGHAASLRWTWPVNVAPDMPGATKGRKLNWGAYRFSSLQDYHDAAGVIRGSHSVSGGMWSGLSVVPGTTGGSLMFRSSSRSYVTTPISRKRGASWRKTRADNALKAWVVLKNFGNVLVPTQAEIDGVLAAVDEVTVRALSQAMGGVVEWRRDAVSTPGRGVYERLIRAVNRGQVGI